jgi:transcriptional regulator
MYQPVEFGDADVARARAHVERNPFGVLVALGPDGLAAAHLPFITVHAPDGFDLATHGASRNELLSGLRTGDPVLAIFSGPHAYVSPAHYRAETDVPTWNYTAVHISGRVQPADGEATRNILERTVHHAETSPDGYGWSLDRVPAAMLRSAARGVVAFRIAVTRIEGGYKLSQDKLEEDVRAVESGLDAGGRSARDVAAEMRRSQVAGRTGAPSTDPETWLGPLR